MAKFILCWHKPPKVEEVEAAKADKDWANYIAWGRLDVLKIKDGKPFILNSAGRWSRLPKQTEVAE